MKWVSAKIKPPVEYEYTDISDVEKTGIAYDFYQSDEYLVLLQDGGVAVAHYIEGYWRDVRTPNAKAELHDYYWTDCHDVWAIIAYMPLSELPEFKEEEN